MSISLCEGQIPLRLVSEPPKRFVTVNVSCFISILLHLSFWLFNILYKRINSKRYIEYQNFKHHFLYISKENIHLNVTNIFAIIFAVTTYAIILPYSLKHPSEIEKYPTYMIIYFEHCIHPNLSCGIGTALYFLKNEKVRSDFWQEVKVIFGRFR